MRIREAIVVEGKYDKIRLTSAVDALVIETHGFGIFKNREQLNLLRILARERGLLVLTDSDSAGFVIRNYVNGVIPTEQVKHAYIPEIFGRERRKDTSSKEGLLGVEGMDSAVITAALRRAGATIEGEAEIKTDREELTKWDLYEAGLTGKADSAARREQLLILLGLPKKLSSNRLLDILNATMSRDQFFITMTHFR